MHVKETSSDALSALRTISGQLDELYSEIHSLKTVIRSLFRGRDFEGQARRAADLESRVCALRTTFSHHVGPRSSSRLRPLKAYWCNVFLAATSLAEITARDRAEAATEARSTHAARQESIERYQVAMQGAKKEWRRLSRHPEQWAGSQDG